MSDYYIRYRNGEHRAVWSELCALEPDGLSGALRCEALDVAKAFVDRCHDNLSVLRRTLSDCGYEFARPDSVLVDATAADVSALDMVEASMGLFPLVLRIWYQRLACVDFRQNESQLFCDDDSRETHGRDVRGLGANCVLVFLRVHECIDLRDPLFGVQDDVIDRASTEQQLLPLGSCASNNEPKGVWLPDHGFDTVLYNDGAGDIRFGDELRRAFEFGGFPFWGTLARRRRMRAAGTYVPDFSGLLPLLVDGIQPV